MTDIPDLASAIEELDRTFGANPLAVIRQLESAIPASGTDRATLAAYLGRLDVSDRTLLAALEVKRVAGQINVLVHTAGILATLPHILEEGEKIESLSLGAGNTGKDFDLTTDRRIAEFKFIAWKGGPESIRKNQVFKDFLKLLWDTSGRRRQLYLTGTREALSFLQGGRALSSVLSKDVALNQQFISRFGERYQRVGEFYREVQGEVEIVDLFQIIPALRAAPMPAEEPLLSEL